MSRPASPTRPDNNLDATLKLAAYRIFADKGTALPPALQDHVNTIALAPRDPSVPISPNAGKVTKHRRAAAQQNEPNGMKRIEPYMLFRGEAEDDARVEAVPLVYSKDDINLHRYFLPPAPDRTVTEDWKPLSQPRPDTALGYITRQDAQSTDPPSPAAFSAAEERRLDSFCLTQYLLFPFLTSQWKAANSKQNLADAHNQAARDGAVITNYLYQFYRAAYPDEEPSVVDTAHYSFTSDLYYGQIWAHWRDEDGFYMEQIFELSLRKRADIEEARGILKNVVRYALGERLEKIKKALPAFAQSRARSKGPTVRPATSTTTPSEVGSAASASASASEIGSMKFVFQVPLTPESGSGSGRGGSEPAKKRRLDHVS